MLISKLKVLYTKGFFHIFTSNILNKIIQFCSGIFLVKVISKQEYGLFTYAQNILMLLMVLSGLGVGDAVLQFGSKARDSRERNAVFKYAFLYGGKFNIFLCILILFLPFLIRLKIPEAKLLLSSMFFMPIFMFILDMLQRFLRVTLDNKKFSYLNNLSSITLFSFSIIGAYFLKSKGIVLGRYFSYFLTCGIGLFFIRETFNIKAFIKYDEYENKKEMIKFSIVSVLNNGISQILYLIDLFLIGYIIGDLDILASYKVATLIPFGLKFVPQTVITFIYPYFVKKSGDKDWMKKNTIKVIGGLFCFNGVISTVGIMLAPFIISVLFGNDYSESIYPFKILMFGFFIMGTFRIPAGNILVMLGKIKFNTYNAIISGIANIILDICLILKYGSNGAAVATVSIFIISSILGMYFLFKAIDEIGR